MPGDVGSDLNLLMKVLVFCCMRLGRAEKDVRKSEDIATVFEGMLVSYENAPRIASSLIDGPMIVQPRLSKKGASSSSCSSVR